MKGLKILAAAAFAAALVFPLIGVRAQAETSPATLLFWSDRDGDFDLYTMSADGSGDAVTLTANDAGDAWGVWSPDGSQIAFESDRDGHRKLYVMSADGTGNALSFTEAEARDTGPAAWSPDGTHLAFMSFLPGDDVAYLIVAAVDGSNVQKLTPGLPRDFLANTVIWSPAGDLLVFEGPDAQGGDIQDIYSIKPDGSAFHNLTQTPQADVWPAFSPDGSLIVYAAEQGGGNVDLWVMNTDGTNPVNLTNTPDRYDSRPVWSPDGSLIAFVSTSLQDASDQQLYLMNADGSYLHALTTDSGQKDFPAWSPDSSQIAYQVTQGAQDIAVINVDGSSVQPITQDDATDYFPQFKPAE